MSKDWQPVAVRMSPREVLERLAASEESERGERGDDAQPDQTVTSAIPAAPSK